jgi:hypothetical protein
VFVLYLICQFPLVCRYSLILFARYLIYNSPQNICICLHLCLLYLVLARFREIFQGTNLLTELNIRKHGHIATKSTWHVFHITLHGPCRYDGRGLFSCCDWTCRSSTIGIKIRMTKIGDQYILPQRNRYRRPRA